MLARVAAIALIVLVLSPFTAPFPTCDLHTFGGHDAPTSTPLSPKSLADAGSSHLIPVGATFGRARLAALSGALSGDLPRTSALRSPRFRPSGSMATGHSASSAVLRI